MNSFTAAAVLCFAVISAVADAETTAAGPGTTAGAGGKLDPAAESAICGGSDLAKICASKGEADATCKDVATKVKGRNPQCQSVGVCSLNLPDSKPLYVSTTAEVPNATLGKKCSGIYILTGKPKSGDSGSV